MTIPANFPLFDGHMHYSQKYLDEALASYEECGVIGGINLWGSAYGIYRAYTYPFDYAEFLDACAKRNLFDRLVQFYWPDWRQFSVDPAGFIQQLCRDLRRFAAMGCRGLKVWKDLGMFDFFADGKPAFMDDPRITPVWETCADLTSRPTGPTPEAWTAFLEKYADRLYIGPDLAMPSNRPPDRPWNRDECYTPWRQRLLSWNLRPATLEKIAWRNGVRDYSPSESLSLAGR